MWKFIVTAIAVYGFWLGFSPSEALACGPVCQKGYQTAGGNGGYSNYGYYPRYDRGYYNQPYIVVPPRKRKPRPGDICYMPDGSGWGLDKSYRWYPMSGPSRTSATRVRVTCDEFDATMPEPAPAYDSVEQTSSSFYKDGVTWVCKRSGSDNLCTPLQDASAQQARSVRKAESILPQPEAPARRQPTARQPAPRPAATDPGIVGLTVDQVTGRTGTLSDYDPAQ